MEFKDCVIFMVDGVCPVCDEVKSILQEVTELWPAFADTYQLCSNADIEKHPDRIEIMMEIQFQNGSMPAVRVPVDGSDKCLVFCGTHAVTWATFIRDSVSKRLVKGEAVK